jgi:hypothetical protein
VKAAIDERGGVRPFFSLKNKEGDIISLVASAL